MKITTDWHIHTTHSCDCTEGGIGVPLADLLPAARAQGITDLGITDHVNPPYNLDDIHRAREAFAALPFDPRLHFGVEAGCVSRWELDAIESGRELAGPYGLRDGGPAGGPLALGLAEEDRDAYGIEYVVGGVHWPLYVPLERDAVIADYQRQYLFLAAHPLVDIVAHPWWWMGGWADEEGRYRTDPWLDDFGKIPLSHHDAFAAALQERDTALEINPAACPFNPPYPEAFQKQYVHHPAYMRERGVRFAVGSDTHGPAYDPPWEDAARILEDLGLADDDLWRLPPRPAPAPSASDPDKPLSKYQQKLARKRAQDGET